MGTLAIILFSIGYYRGQGEHINGIKSVVNLVTGILPLLIFALVVAGMTQVLIPKETVAKWIGPQSGMRGIFLGTIAGALAPGGPYVNMPIVAALLHAGAGIGTAVAFLTAWSLLAVNRLPLEVGLLGWKFALLRLASVFFFPPLAGLIAHFLFSGKSL
jgi:uncharacterized membrane protein YraQ (UPF0718 family)